MSSEAWFDHVVATSDDETKSARISLRWTDGSEVTAEDYEQIITSVARTTISVFGCSKVLRRDSVADWLRAEADAIESAFDMGFPLEAHAEIEGRANVLRCAAKELKK